MYAMISLEVILVIYTLLFTMTSAGEEGVSRYFLNIFELSSFDDLVVKVFEVTTAPSSLVVLQEYCENLCERWEMY